MKVILVEEPQAALVTKVGKLPQARPIPGIEPREIIAAQAVPGCPLPASRKGLLVERRQDVGVDAPVALVIVAATKPAGVRTTGFRKHRQRKQSISSPPGSGHSNSGIACRSQSLASGSAPPAEPVEAPGFNGYCRAVEPRVIMSSPPRVSVVMAVHNAAGTVGHAIASIVGQTFADWEFIIVEDHSTDESGRMIRDFATQDRRVRPLTTPRQGLVPALNAGLAAARGECIARMDADDVCHPERLAEQVALLDARPDLGVAGCLVAFGGNPVTGAGYARHVAWLNTLLTPEAIALNRFVESPLANPSTLFRRSLLDRFGGYREGWFPEDYEFWLRLLEGGVRAAKVPRVLFTWRDSPGRLTRNDARYRPQAFYAIKAEYLAREVERRLAGREVWIWGAGRVTRRRAELLLRFGVRIAGYIDIDPAKARANRLPQPVVLPEAMPTPAAALVLSYVGTRGAREIIRGHLATRGFTEGRDFLMAA